MLARRPQSGKCDCQILTLSMRPPPESIRLAYPGARLAYNRRVARAQPAAMEVPADWGPLRIALATRGTGHSWFTWLGPSALERGALVAAPFRRRLEIGVVLGPDTRPPAGELLCCWPLELPPDSRFRQSLLALCELACILPDEALPQLLLDSGRQALRLELAIPDPQRLSAAALAACAAWLGRLTPAKAAQLAASPHWPELALAAAGQGAEAKGTCLRLSFAGTACSGRARAEWKRAYAVDNRQARLLGLPTDQRAWPGHYLGGLATPPSFEDLPKAPPGAAPGLPAAAAALPWEQVKFDPAWGLQMWLPEPALRTWRWQADWADLRRELPGWLGAQAGAGRRLLAVFPQAWMLDRLWPQLAPWAAGCARYRPELGAAAAQSCLDLAAQGGAVVAGLQSAWKLLCYQNFEAVLLVDPTHPQYRIERAPHLDSRAALLAAAAARPHPPELYIVEQGLSAFDGGASVAQLSLYPPQQPDAGAPTALADRDPLPLSLRRPDRRYLVYFNRLGASRGVFCVECEARVDCPHCGSAALRYSARERRYECGRCAWQAHELRCPSCGLSVLSAAQPGLEAVSLRAGDIAVTSQTHKAPGPHTQRLLGTSRLLDEESGFWPEEVVYVSAAELHGPLGPTLDALDMALRLKSLYANPELQRVSLVGQGLFDEFASDSGTRAAEALHGHALAAAQLTQRWKAEMRLRKLGGLPPYGCLYRLRLLSGAVAPAQALRDWLGARLSGLEGTTLLRLSKVQRDSRGAHLSGYWINSAAGWEWLQETRSQAREQGATLWFAALRGPWD